MRRLTIRKTLASHYATKKRGLRRYRLRDYRIICEIQEAKLIVLVIAIGHRGKIYE